MGREIRRVPKDWKHPRNARGDYEPLLEPSAPIRELQRMWDEARAAWESKPENEGEDFAAWDGNRPVACDFMPWWPDDERTHFQMYEDTSEGTPISPVMESIEAVCRWCADTKASVFADMPATYERWLDIARGGFSGLTITIPRDVDNTNKGQAK